MFFFTPVGHYYADGVRHGVRCQEALGWRGRVHVLDQCPDCPPNHWSYIPKLSKFVAEIGNREVRIEKEEKGERANWRGRKESSTYSHRNDLF